MSNKVAVAAIIAVAVVLEVVAVVVEVRTFKPRRDITDIFPVFYERARVYEELCQVATLSG